MNKCAQVQALFPVGAVVECVENTYIPARAGVQLRITRSGVSVCDADVLRGHLAKPGECGAVPEGPGYRLTLPTRVRDVRAVDDVSATYQIGRDDHTVTYRRVA